MAKTSLEELQKKRDVLEARIRAEQAKRRSRARKLDTRRKVLAGAAVLHHIEQDAALKAQLLTLLDGFLTRADDRALFDLPPQK